MWEGTKDAALHPIVTKHYPAHSVSGAKMEKPARLLLLLRLVFSSSNRFYFLLCYQKFFLERGFQIDIVRKSMSELISNNPLPRLKKS